jgi:hypothetical protein
MATSRDLLKEAIADAKAVKETAIASAKAALEEAFTPYLKEKLSAKLTEMEESDDVSEIMYDEAEKMNEAGNEELDEISLDELLAELENDKMEESISEAKDKEESEGEVSIGDMTPEEFEKFIEPEIMKVIKTMIDSGELEAGPEGMGGEEGDEDEDIDDDVNDDDENIDDEDIDINELLAEDEIDEDISLEELLAELGDEDRNEAYEAEEPTNEELEEAYSVIETLRSELNEINLLNAKLLYTNKIFRNKSLTESQKIKVLTAFDKATSKKEAQLVYETLLENLKTPTTKSPIKESLGSASKVLGTAKSAPIIENDAFARMRELAGIKKSN